MHYKRSGQVVKGQGHRMKTLSDRHVSALVWEVGVVELIGDVGILIGSWEIEVCTHARQNFAKTAQNDWRDVKRPNVMHSQLPPFLANFNIFFIS